MCVVAWISRLSAYRALGFLASSEFFELELVVKFVFVLLLICITCGLHGVEMGCALSMLMTTQSDGRLYHVVPSTQLHGHAACRLLFCWHS